MSTGPAMSTAPAMSTGPAMCTGPADDDCRAEAPSLVDLESEIWALAATMADSRARLLTLIGQFDAADGWVASGAISCAHWLADLLDVEVSTAREKVRVARALRRLPATDARFTEGALSYAKARQLTRVATADNEVELLALADRHPAGHLGKVLADWQQRHDPEAAAARRERERGVTTRTAPSGNRITTVTLPPEQSAVFEGLLDSVAMDASAGASSPGATLAQQRADALVRVVTGLAHASADASSPFRPELILHRRIGETTLDDGTPLPPQVTRRLTCDADARVMTHWPDGSPADVGRRQRLVTARLRLLVRERDGGHCQAPGCRARHFLQVHHVVHWEDGGATDLDNLSLLCSYHHRRAHPHRARASGR